MGFPVGSTIGKELGYGYPGGYAIQPDMLVGSALNVSTEYIKFGELLQYKADMSGVELVRSESFTMGSFAGIATRAIKTPESYEDQNVGGYAPNSVVGVFKRGIISVSVVTGTVKLGGKVYYRVKTNDAETKPIGFCGEEDQTSETKTVELTGLQFASTLGSNGVAAVVIKEKMNV